MPDRQQIESAKRTEAYAKQVRDLVATLPYRTRQHILAKAGLMMAIPSDMVTGKSSLAELKVIQYNAMKVGMLDNDPQMVRAFAEFCENFEGKEQVGNVNIKIVPHDIPDKVPERLFEDANKYR